MMTIRWILSLLALLVAGCTAPTTDYHFSKWIRVPQTLEREEVLWEGPLEHEVAYGALRPQSAEEIRKYEKEIHEYQKAHGLPETGKLDDVTLKALVVHHTDYKG